MDSEQPISFIECIDEDCGGEVGLQSIFCWKSLLNGVLTASLGPRTMDIYMQCWSVGVQLSTAVQIVMRVIFCIFFFKFSGYCNTSASCQHHILSVLNNFVQFLINERTLAQNLTIDPIPNHNPNPNPKMWKNARVVINYSHYAHFTFLQHLTPSQTFIPLKKINYDSEEKKLQKVGFKPGSFRAADVWRCPLGHSRSQQKWFNCAIYGIYDCHYTCYSIITGYKAIASLLVGTDRTWCWREALVIFYYRAGSRFIY